MRQILNLWGATKGGMVVHPHTQPFANWAQRRIAQAIEAGDLGSDLALRFGAQLAAASSLPTRATREVVVERLAETLAIPLGEASEMLDALERLPSDRQVRSLRQTLHQWLESRLRARQGRD
jgi:hypothetical protein